MVQKTNLVISVRCQEPDGVPSRRFVTDEGMLPAAVPGVSGNKIIGVSNTSAKFGEEIPVIVEGSAEVESAGLAGKYEEMVISGSPPVASYNETNNGSFISSDATGKAVAAALAAATDLGILAPGKPNHALQDGDFVEVLLIN